MQRIQIRIWMMVKHRHKYRVRSWTCMNLNTLRVWPNYHFSAPLTMPKDGISFISVVCNVVADLVASRACWWGWWWSPRRPFWFDCEVGLWRLLCVCINRLNGFPGNPLSLSPDSSSHSVLLKSDFKSTIKYSFKHKKDSFIWNFLIIYWAKKKEAIPQ